METPPGSTLEERLRTLLRADLRQELPDKIDAFLDAVRTRFGDDADDATLRRYLCPQWVVLAGGRGSRIDSSFRLNKLIDIWFGEANTLHLACRHLPGDRPPIVVVNPETARRLLRSGVAEPCLDEPGPLDEAAIDPAKRDHYLGEGAIVVVQPVPNGTGGALRAAEEVLRASDAEFIGVSFGDEAFLERRLYLETLAAHVISGADATLCGKRPDAVVDKGGLFFDEEGRFVGTKEWYDMTPEEQEQMHAALARGEAITNTGNSILRREAVLERFPRLWLHKGGTEYHHVDFFRLFYDDGLKTCAHVYEGEIRSGINRWQNVFDGMELTEAQVRKRLARERLRVHPNARITVGGDLETFLAEGRIGTGCSLAGRVHLGGRARIADYCYLEDVTLSGDVDIGLRTRLVRSDLADVAVRGKDDGSPVGAPIRELATLTEIEGCTLRNVLVGEGARLTRVSASHVVLPPNVALADVHIGIRRDPGLGMPYATTPTLYEFVPEDYLPGVFTFGEKRGLEDWGLLRDHVYRMVEHEIAPRATRDAEARRLLVETTRAFWEWADGRIVEALTPEELWGVLYDLTTLITGNPDPYRADKRASRDEAFRLAERFRPGELDLDALLRLDIAANLIDFTSARMLARMKANPDFLAEALAEALDISLSIDSTAAFRARLFEAEPQNVLWLSDNEGEIVFDLHVIRRLLSIGHRVTVAARSTPASNDVTLADLRTLLEDARFEDLRRSDRLTVIGSGSNTAGTNLFRATPEFVHALREADIVVAKGQGNWYTTQGLRKDTFYLLLSKGVTAERSTGVVPDRARSLDGLIAAFVPRDATPGTLREIAVTNA